MQIHFFRNATMRFTYAGKTILGDPMLSKKGQIMSFAGIEPNPTVELPVPAQEIVEGIEHVLLTHSHPDHYDPAAVELLPKDIGIYCQPDDLAQLQKDGFTNVQAVEDSLTWQGIKVTRTGGWHGQGDILKMLGNISGFVLQAEGQPTVYWIGDSIWCKEVEDAISQFKPDIIIAHTGGAVLANNLILMDADQAIQVIKSAPPTTTVVAIHMESLDHCTVTRKALRERATKEGIDEAKLLIPQNGDVINVPKNYQVQQLQQQ